MVETEEGSKSTVQRWFSLSAVKPRRSDTFKPSTEPFSVEKACDNCRATPAIWREDDNQIYEAALRVRTASIWQRVKVFG